MDHHAKLGNEATGLENDGYELQVACVKPMARDQLQEPYKSTLRRYGAMMYADMGLQTDQRL